jgi:hypothetical protein
MSNPGCFAAASVFAHESEVCRNCKAFTACAEESIKTLEAIKGLVNVTDLMKRHERARLSIKRTPPTLPEGWVRQEDGKVKPPPDFVAKAQYSDIVSDGGMDPRNQPTIAGSSPPAGNVKPVERKTKVERVLFEISAEDEAILSELPKKPGEHARRLCAANMIEKIKAELQAGRNALAESKPEFLAIAIDQLLNGGLVRSKLIQAYLDKTNMSVGAAAPHATQAIQILTAFGIAQDNGNCLVVTPA